MNRRAFTWLLCVGTVFPSVAQVATPSAEQMIEQLKLPKTRSMRNLAVEPASATTGTDSVRHQSNLEQVSTTQTGQPVRPSVSLLIQFDFNSARVRPGSHQALITLAQALQSVELTGSKFAVEGHTDAKGNAVFNQRLSEQRAQSVREFLKNLGIDEARLVATGKGSTALANSAQPFAAENRRVRIVNLE